MGSILNLNGKKFPKAKDENKCYWYETHQRVGFPGTIGNWPKQVAAPQSSNGMLVRQEANFPPTEIINRLGILGDEMAKIIDELSKEAQNLLQEVQPHVKGLRKGHKSLELMTKVQELLIGWSELNERG